MPILVVGKWYGLDTRRTPIIMPGACDGSDAHILPRISWSCFLDQLCTSD